MYDSNEREAAAIREREQDVRRRAGLIRALDRVLRAGELAEDPEAEAEAERLVHMLVAIDRRAPDERRGTAASGRARGVSVWKARCEEELAALWRMHDAARVFTAEWERDNADTSDEPNFEPWELTTAAIDGLVAAARDAQEARVEQWRALVRELTTR